MLEPFGIQKWLAKKRPLLTKGTAAKRYTWAKKYSKWTVTEWSNVLFSDECSVERGVWAAIPTAGLSNLVMIRRDLSAKKQGFTTRSYLQVSKDDLLPIILETDIYQQAGARIHTSKAAKAWFRRNSIEWLEDWPPYSPDLDPIEHLWPLLKEKLYELYPDIE
jgi:hypothetical protein